MTSIGRELPHSREAEECVLSAILIDAADVIGKCQAAGIRPESFYDPKHSVIYDRLLGMHADQKPIAIDTLAEDMKTAKLLDQAGGIPFLVQISRSSPTTAQAGFFVDQVRQLALLRAIIRGATGIVEEAYAFTGEFDALTRSIDRLAGVFTSRTEIRTWRQAVKEAEDLTRERMKPPEQRNTSAVELSWGIPDFDRFFQPIELGELIVIGGYTSSGKSSLLRQVAWAIAKAGHPALIETLEVRDAEEAINLAAHESGVRSRARLHELHPKDQEQLLDAFKKIDIPHFSVCHQDSNIAQIFARARAFKRKHGLRFLGTDYLQILEDVKKLREGERPDFAIGVVTSACKRFATTEETTVALLSGFNRNYVNAGGRDPILSDLDGSSNIEKDASRVLLIHVPEQYRINGATFNQSLTADSTDQPRFFVKVIQAKGRNQGTSSIGMFFHRETKSFHQITR